MLAFGNKKQLIQPQVARSKFMNFNTRFQFLFHIPNNQSYLILKVQS